MGLIFLLVSFFIHFSDEARAERACTMIGCESGVLIDVPNDYRWLPGKYVFSFRLDGKKINCRAKLPLPPCDRRAVACDQEGISIMESGCALPQSEHGFGRISLSSFPAAVELSVRRNGREIGTLKGNPVYKELRPNGEECEPVCRQASLNIPLK